MGKETRPQVGERRYSWQSYQLPTGEEVKLSPKNISVLEYLLEQEGNPVSTSQIRDACNARHRPERLWNNNSVMMGVARINVELALRKTSWELITQEIRTSPQSRSCRLEFTLRPKAKS